ncbi:MAG: DUF2474 domain-containing protein [Xanthobacteraceae bacterium]
MAATGAGRKPWLRRVGWLILIWSLSVAALGAVAALFRLLMHAAGLIG